MSEESIGKSVFHKIDKLLDKVNPTTTDQKLNKANILALKAVAVYLGKLGKTIEGLQGVIKPESPKSIQ